ncbi:MAG: hypothetical protein XD78_1082 [Desulfotomaculum sp. 46_296]|nr:MAG: hypothetical protein XD78_1082 [Desulfotomaculum sp. 46_296]
MSKQKRYYSPGQPQQVIEGLKSALLDERTTAAFYAALRDMSEKYPGVEAFSEARRDELDHMAKLTAILEDLTGTTPPEATQPVSPPIFSDYCQGLAIAIQGEQDAYQKYTGLIQISPYKRVNDLLDEIRNDEEVHLAKINKIYEMNCLNKQK